MAGPHRRETGRRSAAEQVDQDRLRLVVGGVAGEHVRRAAPRSGRRGPAPRGSARRRRRRVTARNVAPSAAARSRDDVGLGRRPGAQAVVDVHRLDVAPCRNGEHEQRRRVGAARHGAGHGACPAQGTCSAAAAVVDDGSRTARRQEARRPARANHRCGSRISSSVGRLSGDSQQRSTTRGPPCASTAAMNRSPAAYWFIFASSPIRRCTSLANGSRCLRRSRSTVREPLGVRDDVARGAIHRHVTVTFEQRHQPTDAGEHGALLLAGDQADHAVLADALACLGRVLDALPSAPSRSAAGSGLARRRLSSTRPTKYGRIHGTPVNWARWVSSWMQHPHPELVGVEPELLLERRPGSVRRGRPRRRRCRGRGARRTGRGPACSSSRAAGRPRRRRAGGWRRA